MCLVGHAPRPLCVAQAQTPWRRISDHAVTISAVEDWEPDELTAVLALCIRYQLQPDWEAMLASDPLEDMMSSIKDHHRNAVSRR